MILLAKYVLFLFAISIIFSFGFVILRRTLKINSLMLLLPLSFSIGISSYLSLCHCLAYMIGPQASSVVSLLIQLTVLLLIALPNYKSLMFIEQEITYPQLKKLAAVTLLIIILSFLALTRFGSYDKGSHFPIALTIFHNNTYPPKDLFRPDYVLLYHYGGDLFVGALHYISQLEISTSFELILSICTGTIFLSFFVLAWLITKSFKISIIGAFCTYFGGGFLWLDAIFRYLHKNFPPDANNWSFFETFLNLGLHGGITEAPSVTSFVPTYALGYPILISSLILFWKLTEDESSNNFLYLLFLNILLLSLFLIADWLYITFLGAIIPYSIYLLLFKERKKPITIALTLCVASVLLNKSIGNALFLQDATQHLGRANIFNLALKEKPFWLMSWRILNKNIDGYQPVYCFSWDFLSEFGLSLLLSPLVLFYLIKKRNTLAMILFFSLITTMPLPTILDFTLNPAELNRLFHFGNRMLILLITCSIGILFKSFFDKKVYIYSYIVPFCLSPLLGLIFASIFTPNIYSDYHFTAEVLGKFKNETFIDFNKRALRIKNNSIENYKSEIDFLKRYSRENDVAISNFFELPVYAGVYSIIPPGRSIYWDQLYTKYNSIYNTIFHTLDPFLLQELNIKWILITKSYKDKLPKEAKRNLENSILCNLVYNRTTSESDNILIYHVNKLDNYLVKNKRKTAWLLQYNPKQPIVLFEKGKITIPIFTSSKKALSYLDYLCRSKPNIKNKFITAQVYKINNLEEQIKKSKKNITLSYEF